MKKRLILGILISIVACRKDSPVKEPCQPQDVTGMLPLQIGNQWIYKVTYYDTTGAVTLTTADTVHIYNDTIINCTRQYTLFPSSILFNGIPGHIIFQETSIISNNDSGFVFVDGYIPYPVVNGPFLYGEELSYYDPRSNTTFRCNVDYYLHCNAADVYDSTMNQTFHCINYVQDSIISECASTPIPGIEGLANYKLHSSYCPGVGLIEKVTFGNGNIVHDVNDSLPLYSKMELMNYTLH